MTTGKTIASTRLTVVMGGYFYLYSRREMWGLGDLSLVPWQCDWGRVWERQAHFRQAPGWNSLWQEGSRWVGEERWRRHLAHSAGLAGVLGGPPSRVPMREGEGGMIWENSIETCILPHVKWITSPGSMHETGCSGPVHWDDTEGWDGEGGGRGVQDGEHMYTHGWFMWMYGKTHYNIVK